MQHNHSPVWSRIFSPFRSPQIPTMFWDSCCSGFRFFFGYVLCTVVCRFLFFFLPAYFLHRFSNVTLVFFTFRLVWYTRNSYDRRNRFFSSLTLQPPFAGQNNKYGWSKWWKILYRQTLAGYAKNFVSHCIVNIVRGVVQCILYIYQMTFLRFWQKENEKYLTFQNT